MAKIETIKCKCAHEFQDSVHGKGNRSFTVDKDGHKHCTVCGGKAQWVKKLAAHALNWLPIHSMK
jgi:hypothetical protein